MQGRLAVAFVLVAGVAVTARAEPPAAPSPAAGASALTQPMPADELERRLAAAHERLEQAASEVAMLSRQQRSQVVRLRAGTGPRYADDAARPPGDDAERTGSAHSFVVVKRGRDRAVVLLQDVGELGLAIPGFDAASRPSAGTPLPWHGLELATLTPDLGRYFGATRGVLVLRAPADDRLSLRDGDVITAIDGREPRDAPQVLGILDSYVPGERLALSILRDRRARSLVLTMPPAAGPSGHASPRAPPTPPAPPAPPAPPLPSAPGPG
jgi:hypothetical protein